MQGVALHYGNITIMHASRAIHEKQSFSMHCAQRKGGQLHMKLRTKLLSLVCIGALIASCTGAYATWTFSGSEPVSDMSNNIEVSMNEFVWDTAEILPSDVATQNHIHLINGIVEDLNEESSDLNTQIDTRENYNRDEFGSMDLWMEDKMEQLFGLDTTGLSFLLHFPSDEPNTRYLYTTNIDMGESGVLWGSGSFNIPKGEYVYQIFQTRLELVTDENGNQSWTPVETKLGYAESDEYPNTYAGTWLSTTPAFAPETFTEGVRGTTKDTAIYAFVGQSSTIYTDSADDLIWYKLKHNARGTRTIISYDTKCTITVYNANGTRLAASTKTTDANGTACVSVSWTGTANTQYYFTLTGNTAIDFKIS